MILIIGGAYQGKLEYATTQLGYSKEIFLDGETCSYQEAKEAAGIHRFHRLIFRMIQEKVDPWELIHTWTAQTNIIILCNELGCGVVPMDSMDREYRECVGRILCELAQKSSQVHRVYCGIGTVIS